MVNVICEHDIAMVVVQASNMQQHDRHGDDYRDYYYYYCEEMMRMVMKIIRKAYIHRNVYTIRCESMKSNAVLFILYCL